MRLRPFNTSCYYSTPIGCGVLLSTRLFVSVYPRVYLWNRWTDLHKILYADPLWLWLGPPAAALRYVMYFRFHG